MAFGRRTGQDHFPFAPIVFPLLLCSQYSQLLHFSCRYSTVLQLESFALMPDCLLALEAYHPIFAPPSLTPVLGIRLRGREAMGNGAFCWLQALLSRALPISCRPTTHRGAAIGRASSPRQSWDAGLLARWAVRYSRLEWCRARDRRAPADDLLFVGQFDPFPTVVGVQGFCADHWGRFPEIARPRSPAGSFRRCS